MAIFREVITSVGHLNNHPFSGICKRCRCESEFVASATCFGLVVVRVSKRCKAETKSFVHDNGLVAAAYEGIATYSTTLHIFIDGGYPIGSTSNHRVVDKTRGFVGPAT